VLDIQLQNKALLLIWIWIANSDETSLWASTLRHVGHHLPLQPTTHASTDASFFLQDLHKLQPIMAATSMTDNQGILRWWLTPNQQFTVHSAYKFLNNPGIPNPTLQRVWQTTTPPKIKIFIWLLLQNKLQTAENLQRKGWPTITVCIMCNTGTQKSTNHLFTSCPTAATLPKNHYTTYHGTNTQHRMGSLAENAYSLHATKMGGHGMDNLEKAQPKNIPRNL
jgi:zinc-binding in reverse transcriptase